MEFGCGITITTCIIVISINANNIAAAAAAAAIAGTLDKCLFLQLSLALLPSLVVFLFFLYDFRSSSYTKCAVVNVLLPLSVLSFSL